jgi:hypothetical protein
MRSDPAEYSVVAKTQNSFINVFFLMQMYLRLELDQTRYIILGLKFYFLE